MKNEFIRSKIVSFGEIGLKSPFDFIFDCPIESISKKNNADYSILFKWTSFGLKRQKTLYFNN